MAKQFLSKSKTQAMSTHLNYLYLMNKASEADDRQTYYYYLKQANQAKANEISMRSLQADEAAAKRSN